MPLYKKVLLCHRIRAEVSAIVKKRAAPLVRCPAYNCPRPGMRREKIEAKAGDFFFVTLKI
jgi:hypothetical protein